MRCIVGVFIVPKKSLETQRDTLIARLSLSDDECQAVWKTPGGQRPQSPTKITQGPNVTKSQTGQVGVFCIKTNVKKITVFITYQHSRRTGTRKSERDPEINLSRLLHSLHSKRNHRSRRCDPSILHEKLKLSHDTRFF